jgi:hypothetical protein
MTVARNPTGWEGRYPRCRKTLVPGRGCKARFFRALEDLVYIFKILRTKLILTAGQAVSACGGLDAGPPTRQEPTEETRSGNVSGSVSTTSPLGWVRMSRTWGFHGREKFRAILEKPFPSLAGVRRARAPWPGQRRKEGGSVWPMGRPKTRSVPCLEHQRPAAKVRPLGNDSSSHVIPYITGVFGFDRSSFIPWPPAR